MREAFGILCTRWLKSHNINNCFWKVNDYESWNRGIWTRRHGDETVV